MKISRRYWDSILACCKDLGELEVWRIPVYQEYERLIDGWSREHRLDYVLKTDLFEEATNAPGLVSFFREKIEFLVGIDRSSECLVKARKEMDLANLSSTFLVCCDVRHLPFRPDVFDMVVSNSTLDHFTTKKHIAASLKEISWVTKKGAMLILSMDNPLNPLIFFRNILPYQLLKTLRIIPYYMGSLIPRQELVELMESIGFSVKKSSYISHCPRILLVAAEKLLTQTGSTSHWKTLMNTVDRFELLRRLPTRSLTAYFIMVSATKDTISKSYTGLG